MQVVCDATLSPNMKIKVAALECLVKIMSLYYQYMEPYMAPALFPVSHLSFNVIVKSIFGSIDFTDYFGSDEI